MNEQERPRQISMCYIEEQHVQILTYFRKNELIYILRTVIYCDKLATKTETALECYHAQANAKKPREVAKELGIHPSHYSRLMRGKRRPSLPLALKIRDTIEIPLEELAKSAGPKKRISVYH